MRSSSRYFGRGKKVSLLAILHLGRCGSEWGALFCRFSHSAFLPWRKCVFPDPKVQPWTENALYRDKYLSPVLNSWFMVKQGEFLRVEMFSLVELFLSLLNGGIKATDVWMGNRKERESATLSRSRGYGRHSGILRYGRQARFKST